MKKQIIIGLDLSFNLTGIAISKLNNYNADTLKFFRIFFNPEKNKKKVWVPTSVKNVNDVVYKMPTDVRVDNIVMDAEDENNFEQITATIKAMICSKKIIGIVNGEIGKLLEISGDVNNENTNDLEIIIVIENYIMPSFKGHNQLKTVSGLITLQGYVRGELIKYCAGNKLSFKILTPTPSTNKLHFSGFGGADKDKMVDTFIEVYNGEKLIPTIDADRGSLEDVVDAFSLMIYGYSKMLKNLNIGNSVEVQKGVEVRKLKNEIIEL